MQPILLEHPLSPYAQKNKIALREKKVPFELVMPGSGNNFDLSSTPRREVPALLHDGQVIFDSTIIQEFIEETWTQPSLLPGSASERARVRMIEEIMDTQYEAVVWGFMEVVTFGRAPGKAGESLLERGHQQLSGLNAWLERELGEREWFNGPLALSGSIANGGAILAAQAMGADFAYIGSAFIATEEARALDAYKQCVVDSTSDDIVYSNLFTGVHGNYLAPSIRNAGLDPENLPESDPSKMNFGGDAKKAWKDIWGCGQGIGAITSVVPVAERIAQLKKEYQEARARLHL